MVSLSLSSANALGNNSVVASIVTYGAQAKAFALLIDNDTDLSTVRQNVQGPAVIAVSDMGLVSVAELDSALNNGATIVAINLPSDNGIAGVPTIIETCSTATYVLNEDNTTTVLNSTATITQIVIPSYVISVRCEKPVTLQENFIALNNSLEAQQDMIQKAVESVNKALELHLIKSSSVVVGTGLQSDSTVTPLDQGSGGQNNYWDTAGPYYNQPLSYTNTTTISFGTNKADCLTQNILGEELQAYNSQYEYYRFDVTTDHDLDGDYMWFAGWLPPFPYPIGYCGPYMTSDFSYLQMDSGLDAYLLDYGPSTTTGSQQATVNIGLDVNGPSIGWGWTWQIPDVSYYSGYSSNSVQWNEAYNGPNYWTASPPPACAHDSFRTTRSSVWQSPLYAGINVLSAYSNFYFQTDSVVWEFGWLPIVTSQYYHYSMISQVQYCPSQVPR